jgi:hypothetical protein
MCANPIAPARVDRNRKWTQPPDENAASRTTHGDTKQSERESSSWLVAVRHFRYAVAGRPGPMSTRGALATMPVPPSALRNWALCARMTAAPRFAEGRCFHAAHSVCGRRHYVFHSPGPVCGNGKSLREPHTGLCALEQHDPWNGVEGKFYAATQDHPLRR